MRKFLLLLLLPLFLFSCSKEDSPLSIMVNVKHDGALAAPTLVRLYNYDELHSELMKQVNSTKVNNAYMYGSDLGFKLEDGTTISPAYTSDSFLGVNTLEDIKAGKYYIIVMYKPDGTYFPFSWFYGYKEVVVDKSNNAALYNCNFPSSKRGNWYNF